MDATEPHLDRPAENGPLGPSTATATATRGHGCSEGGAFDLVTLVVSESGPEPGMPSEHARILRLCRRPTAVAELAAELALPVGAVRSALADLLDAGRISARHPGRRPPRDDPDTLAEVLLGLRNL
ncbi:DUF742 domain-containing protein [Streptomyces capparidis]